MSFAFATCDRKRALDFLQRSFPDKGLSDEGAVKDVLDLVEADIIRVGDPDFHGRGRIYPQASYEENADKCLKAMNRLEEIITNGESTEVHYSGPHTEDDARAAKIDRRIRAEEEV